MQAADSLTVDLGTTIELDATQSSDPDSPDGTPDRHEWAIVTQPAGSEGVRLFPSLESLQPTLRADAVGIYTFELTVYDHICADSDRVTVTVQ